jgi:hypothetical protein
LRFRRTEDVELGGGQGQGRSAKKAAPVMLDCFGHGKSFMISKMCRYNTVTATGIEMSALFCSPELNHRHCHR